MKQSAFTGKVRMAKTPPKVCLIGSKEPYPAFDSVSSILRDILGDEQVVELRTNDRLSTFPRLLRFLVYVFIDLILYLKIASLCKREKLNVLLLFQGYYPILCVASKLLSMKLLLFIGGSGFLWSFLENDSTLGRLFTYSNLPMQRICHKFANALITLSESMVETLDLEKYKYKTWFALPRFDKEFYSQFDITKRYEKRENVVGFVGLLSRRKGIFNFVQAIRLVINRNDDCKFLIVGGGPFLEITKTEIQKLKITNVVKITGFVDYDSLKSYYNEMKLCVLPAYAEGVPSTIFEAMACGTPMLATHVGGIPDIISDGKNGFLLEYNTPQHIAENIIKLLNNPKHLQDVSLAAYRHVREDFSEQKVLNSWRRILQSLEVM